MIRLDSTTRKLQAVLGGSVSATQPDVVVNYTDFPDPLSRGEPTASTFTATNNTTAVNICPAPASLTVREVSSITLRNNDSASVVATIQFVDNATNYILVKVTLLTLETLMYEHGSGWTALDASGRVKQ